MKWIRALLPLVFILFVSLTTANTDANTDWIKYMERSESSAGDLLTDTTEGEIKLNDSGKYRDGVIDNFDHFINPGYPSGNMRHSGKTGSDKYAL